MAKELEQKSSYEIIDSMIPTSPTIPSTTSASDRPKILVLNDDGVKSSGLKKLALALQEIGDVVVVATIGSQVHPSFSITVQDSIRAKQLDSWNGILVFAVSGFPMNCLKFAYGHVIPKILKWTHLDLVIAGINKGKNVGTNLLYSGTMSLACAARFAHETFMPNLQTPKAIAISLCGPSLSKSQILENLKTKNNKNLFQFDWDFTDAIQCSKQIAILALKSEQTPNVVWNVNVPCQVSRSSNDGDRYIWAVTRPCVLEYDSSNLVSLIKEDSKNAYFDFVICGPTNRSNYEIGTDCHALQNNIVSISPIELAPSLHCPIHATNNLITLLCKNNALFDTDLKYFWNINVNIRPLQSIVQCLEYWLQSSVANSISLQMYTLYLQRDLKICKEFRNNRALQLILSNEFGWCVHSEQFQRTLSWNELNDLYGVLNDKNNIENNEKTLINKISKSSLITTGTIGLSVLAAYFLKDSMSSNNNNNNSNNNGSKGKS